MLLQSCNLHGTNVIIVYQDFQCPICDRESKVEDLEAKIAELEDEKAVLNGRIEELKNIV